MKFLLAYWNFFLFWIAYPVVFTFPLAYLYSLALVRGIAYARDEQHRMTPLSPWVLFSMRSKRLLIFIAALILPWMFIETSMTWIKLHLGATTWSDAISWLWAEVIHQEDIQMTFAMNCFGVLGRLCLVFGWITRSAPNHAGPLLPTLIGLSLGLMFWSILFSPSIVTNSHDSEISAHFGFFGLLSFVLCWLHSRFLLNREWFRFNDG